MASTVGHDKILHALHAITDDKKVFRRRELVRLLKARLPNDQLPKTHELMQFLSERRVLDVVTLKSESSYQPITRLATPDASPFELALSLKANSYLCHATAVFLHGLTEHVPQTIYVNAEQSPKPKPSGMLTQEALDRAFRQHQRSSRYVYVYQRNRFVILSGKHTDGHGVVPLSATPSGTLRATNLERTLVDITVRPVYGGGAHAVLAAFQAAHDRLSLSKLVRTLRALDYVYPYHQALGFYLERTGVPPGRLDPLRALGLEFDFYVSHGIKDPAYDASWRIFHPKGL